MKMTLSALAIAIALPFAAQAQTAPTPAPEKKCCCEKMAGKMDCCDEHGDHAGHDMSKQAQPK